MDRRFRLALQHEQRLRARRAPIAPHTVVYESFAGNGMLCNPEAIFRAALAAPDLQHLRHVWALTDLEEYAGTVAEFAGDPRVSFVRRDSSRYYRVAGTAKYLINNATFPNPLGKRTDQIYLNTWHGTPLKAMGYDVPGGALDTHNVVRNFVNADYLLAPNADTERMYLSAYRMSNIYRGRIIAEGTPRIDRQFATDAQRAAIRARLAQHAITLDGRPVLLYAPTWKGNFYSPTDDLVALRDLVSTLRSKLGARYQVLVKVHQQIYRRAHGELREVLIPNELPTNEVLALADTLVTDYSSVYIDYLATGRPIVFYTPDLDDYVAGRGVYVPPREWPGPVCRDVADLVKQLDALGSGDADDPGVVFADAYASARERYCAREDGNAAARIVDILFRGNTAGYAISSGFGDGRTPLLINLGGMLANGITNSGLSLLDTIDHDRFDVSACFPYPTSPERMRLVEQINPRVRLFPQPASFNGSKLRVRLLAEINSRLARRSRILARGYPDLMRAEWQRAFGASRFDAVVDFSGYEPYWMKLLASRPSGTYSIWLHNDIAAELSNAGRTGRLRARVGGAVALYHTADHLVSVSWALNEINRAKLAQWAPPDRFSFARNTINADRIRQLAGESSVVPPAAGVRTFVTAGRLSPEKNHARLIRAFARVHATEPGTRLVILGSGPCRGDLEALVATLELTSAVTLAGHHDNPYPTLAAADCFVLASDYEGQPMALLEARILGLAIISTAFGSVRDALPEGVGLVVARDDDALAAGMMQYLTAGVPAPPFDADEYNRAALAEFYNAIGVA